MSANTSSAANIMSSATASAKTTKVTAKKAVVEVAAPAPVAAAAAPNGHHAVSQRHRPGPHWNPRGDGLSSEFPQLGCESRERDGPGRGEGLGGDGIHRTLPR